MRRLPRGAEGEWDEQSVFTPNILVADGRYFLFYTSVEKPYTEEALTAIGVAYASSPDGPWMKYEENPVLRTGPEGSWDSHRVDDALFDCARWIVLAVLQGSGDGAQSA